MAPSTASESRPFLKAGGGHAEPPCRAARRADLLLAKRGPGTQYFCRREFRRRAGARRWSRSSRLPASASREGAAASRLPQSCGGKGGWGKRSSCTSWTRGSLPERGWLLCRGDRGGRGRQREIAIRRVMAVVDCGTVVNPDSVEAQIQGGLIFGLTAAFYNEIIIAKRSEIGPKTRSRITSLRDTPRGEAQQQGRWAKRSTSASWI
jgi:hypothetical protein